MTQRTFIRGPVGENAREQLGVRLPLEILQSKNGFYLGTCDESGPVSRESLEYWPTETAAAKAWADGDWTQV